MLRQGQITARTLFTMSVCVEAAKDSAITRC